MVWLGCLISWDVCPIDEDGEVEELLGLSRILHLLWTHKHYCRLQVEKRAGYSLRRICRSGLGRVRVRADVRVVLLPPTNYRCDSNCRQQQALVSL